MERVTEPGEAAIWSRARAGEGAALAEVFDRHSARVFRHAYAVLRDVHDAEDAAAIAFLELWRRRADVRLVDGSVLPWLLVTVSNAARNVARSGRRYRALLAAMPRGENAASAETTAIDGLPLLEHLDPGLAVGLSALSRIDYLLVTLTAVEGYSTAEAAVAVGINAGTARSRLSRARARLRQQLAAGHPIDAEVH